MQLGEISFCDRIGFNIKSDDIKKQILEELESSTGFRVIQRHFDKYDDSVSFHKINNAPHLVSLRTNGNPYWLYLTKTNFVNQVIFIDKKIQQGYFYPRMIVSKLWFDPCLFNNTLIDGEMVKTKLGKWVFVTNDLVCDNGIHLTDLNLVKRLHMLYNIVENGLRLDETNVCFVEVKRYFSVTKVKEMMEQFMPSLPYTCRGIYFKPFFLKFKDILYNFNDDLIKQVTRIKQKHLQNSTFLVSNLSQIQTPQSKTQDSIPKKTSVPVSTKLFHVRKTNQTDIYDLIEDSKSSSVQIALVNNMATSKMLQDAFMTCNPNDRLLFMCAYNERFKKWMPVEQLHLDHKVTGKAQLQCIDDLN